MLEITFTTQDPSGVKEIRWHGKRIDVLTMNLAWRAMEFPLIDLLLPYGEDTVLEGEFEAIVRISKDWPPIKDKE